MMRGFTAIKIDLLFSSPWNLWVILDWFWPVFVSQLSCLQAAFPWRRAVKIAALGNPASVAYVTLCLQESRSAGTELFHCCLVVKSMVSFQDLYVKRRLKVVGFRLSFSKQLLVCLFACVTSWTHLKGGCLLEKCQPLLLKIFRARQARSP